MQAARYGAGPHGAVSAGNVGDQVAQRLRKLATRDVGERVGAGCCVVTGGADVTEYSGRVVCTAGPRMAGRGDRTGAGDAQ